MTPRPREFDEFVVALESTPSNAVTACSGWTAHEILAHLVSGVEAIAEQAEAHLAGLPIPAYGSFAERETRFWGIDDRELRRRLVAGEHRMTEALERELAADPRRVVPEVGWGMPLHDVVLHLRQEFAVHRWDLVGDDAVGDELLGRPELLDHAVRMLAEPLLARGREHDPGVGSWSLRIRAGDERDVLVEIAGDRRSMALVPQSAVPADIDCDPAARLLLLWGRKPASATRVRTRLDPPALERARRLLSGF